MNITLTIKELENRIKQYQTSYYQGEAEISDAEFDALWDELKKRDPQNVLLQVVGSDLGGVFKKATHIMPMGSQDKAANPEQFTKWATKMLFPNFFVEYKLDGASLELQYKNGVFVKALTRGDGLIGDDISENVKKMKGFIQNLSASTPLFTGGIRAEVIMSHEIYKTHFSDKANCRNAANGIMKRKDGNGCEHLQIICYDALFTGTTAFSSASILPQSEQKTLFFTDTPIDTTQTHSESTIANIQPFKTEPEKLAWLQKMGFTIVHSKLCNTIQEVIEYREEVSQKRESLGFDIDGLVVKSLYPDYEDAKRARPEKQIAFKFGLEQAQSIIRSVIWNESGATYTPVAEFDPVELAGTTVRRASLVNPNTIRSLEVKIGSNVIVTKRGEIIPKIESLAPPNENSLPTTDIIFPTQCGHCGTSLVDEGTRLFCPNTACPKRIHHRLEKWVQVLDIRDFGITLIKRLFSKKRLMSISDIYTLTKQELAQMDGLGEKSAEKIIASIQAKRTVTLAQFIAGFDIEGLGITMIEKLMHAGFTNLESLFALKQESIAEIAGFGDIMATGLINGLTECKDEMLFLVQNNIIYIQETQTQNNEKVQGKSFCFTGELLSMKRTQAQELVKKFGGIVKTSIVQNLSYLVTNNSDSGSTKNKKAQEAGVAIINEKEFLTLFE